MSKTIKTLPFGDRATIARQLSGPAVEKSTAVLAGALLPMVSNHSAGHGTFSQLIKENKPNKACPLQTAVSNLKGRARLARDAVFAMSRIAEDQADHDALLGACECMILQALTPNARPKAKGPTPLETAQGEVATLHAQVISITAERDALAAERDALIEERDALAGGVATLRALLAARESASSPAVA